MKSNYLLNHLIAFTFLLTTYFTIFNAISSQAQQPPNFTNDLISTGWDELEGFNWDSTGQQYVWEKKGLVWIVDTNGVKLTTPLIDIQHEVGNWRDHGLNGFCLHPNFRNNGYFYLFYTVDRYNLLNAGSPGYDSTSNLYFNATISRVTRYQANPATNFTTVIPGSRFVMIGETKKTGIPVLFESHSAGTLLFGTDGSLIVTAGDGAYYNDVDPGSFPYSYYVQALADTIITQKENVGAFRAQLIDCLNGKILRIDPITGDGLSSNPFYDASAPRAARSRVYSLGLRNPFRITLRPGTGDTDQSAGNPGVFYIGDVGWDTWEDVNINDQPGQNFGWPLFEGLEAQPGYMASNAENRDAPNPLFGVNGCTRQFFRFKDLLQNATLNPNATFTNPCNQSILVPANIHTFFHVRPVIDYHHGYYTGITRTGIFNGQNAGVIAINDSASPIIGDTFPGFASIAGIWYNDTRFPPEYQNTYFHADFVGGWIKNFIVDQNNVTSKINSFANNTGYIDYIGLNPTTGCINYARYPNEIRKICYTGLINNPPVAKIIVNLTFGSSPLTVQFTGSQSTDPENLPLQYSWQFGNGGVSSLANPAFTYQVAGNVPTSYYAKLTVTDNVGQTSIDSVLISINNTPPVVQITSFANGALYSMNSNSILPLVATVTDAEHGPNQLFYKWTTILHHNSHIHIELSDTNKISSTTISPLGCVPGVSYYFEIQLEVTDAAGLATTVSSFTYPDCNKPTAQFGAIDPIVCKGDTIKFIDLSTHFPNQWQWSFPGGIPATSTLQNPSVVYPLAGSFDVTLIATSVRGSDTIVKPGFSKVKVFPNVTVTTSNGTNSFCAGSPFSLTATSTSNITNYQWKRYNVPTGTNSAILPLTQGGNFKVIVTDNNGCSKISQKIVITKNLLPTANVTASGPLSICPPASVTFTVGSQVGNTYQWKKYSNIIAGATGTQYTATTAGDYKVLVTNIQNCVSSSAKFSVSVSCRIASLNENTGEVFKPFIYPNPADELINLVFRQKEAGNSSITIYDITGRSTEIVKSMWMEQGEQEVSFDISSLSPGVYQVAIVSNGSLETLKFIRTGVNR